jgi:hypothetical protein
MSGGSERLNVQLFERNVHRSIVIVGIRNVGTATVSSRVNSHDLILEI